MCLSEYLSPDTFSFIESQVKMSKRSRHAYRWKTEDKMLALSIFFHSRKAYKILSQLFILPSVRTLLRDLQKMNQKVPVDDCGKCSDQMLLPQLPSEYDELSACEFLRNKTYKETGCLLYPTIAIAQFLENLESLFCAIFEGIVYIPFIFIWLCKSADKHCQFLTCTDIKCKLRVQNMVKLYMKVQIFYALKHNNAYNTEDKSIKWNRKMLKLKHL